MEQAWKELPKLGSYKSHAEEKFLCVVIETIYDIYSSLSSSGVRPRKGDLERDLTYVKRRFANEGIQFLVRGLSSLGEYYDKVLCKTATERCVGFAPYNGLDPLFLRPVWSHARSFDCESRHCDAQLVKAVRTLLFGLKKVEIPATVDQEAAKLSSFLSIEEELDMFEVLPSPELYRAQLVMEYLCSSLSLDIRKPRHGPGAVSGGEQHEQKWNFSVLFESVHAEWPYWEFLYPVRSSFASTTFTSFGPNGTSPLSSQVKRLQLAAMANEYRALTRVPSPTARLLMVPKDYKGPRIISCEPKELMYLQQGLSSCLVEFFDRHPLTRGHVNFDDQSINAALALSSSKSREFATLDLSDASDRVSVQLVSYLFPEWVSKKLMALRSTSTTYRGRNIPLKKYAPMGSALCFPVESIVFWALCVGTVWEQCNDLSLAKDSVYVYGDDLIIKDEYAERCIKTLESVCLKVNRSKSFMGDIPFRESCGVDAIHGFDVTPLRLKHMPPRSLYDASSIAAWIKYAEHAQYLLPRRSDCILGYVQVHTGPLPRVPVEQSFLSIVTTKDIWSHNDFKNLEWCPDMCYYKVRAFGLSQRPRTDQLQSWRRLQRGLIERQLTGDRKVVDRQSTIIRKKTHYVTYLLVT